jgi:hypothetical protein
MRRNLYCLLRKARTFRKQKTGFSFEDRLDLLLAGTVGDERIDPGVQAGLLHQQARDLGLEAALAYKRRRHL